MHKVYYFVTLYGWIRIERIQRASAQFENLNGHLGPCLGRTRSRDRLLFEPASSIRIQLNVAWKEIGGVIIEMLVSVPQTRKRRLKVFIQYSFIMFISQVKFWKQGFSELFLFSISDFFFLEVSLFHLHTSEWSHKSSFPLSWLG